MSDIEETPVRDDKPIAPVAAKPKKDWRNKSRQKYSLEFKQNVIKEYAVGGLSAKALAKKHKIASDTAIHNWIRTLGGESRRAQRKASKGLVLKAPKAPVTVEKTEGRMDLYIKSDRAMLTQTIGEMYLEIRRLEAKKTA